MKQLGVISIFSNAKQKKESVLCSDNKDKLKLLKLTLNQSFEQVREQFDDHLEAINENTNEIHSNFEYLCEMDRKIEKLAEKVDELNHLIREQRGEKVEERKFELRPLTKKEKEVFYALYVLTEGRRFASYKEISRRACFSEELVASYNVLRNRLLEVEEGQLDTIVESFFHGKVFRFTLRKMLYGAIDHNLYHAGQISLLKSTS